MINTIKQILVTRYFSIYFLLLLSMITSLIWLLDLLYESNKTLNKVLVLDKVLFIDTKVLGFFSFVFFQQCFTLDINRFLVYKIIYVCDYLKEHTYVYTNIFERLNSQIDFSQLLTSFCDIIGSFISILYQNLGTVLKNQPINSTEKFLLFLLNNVAHSYLVFYTESWK